VELRPDHPIANSGLIITKEIVSAICLACLIVTAMSAQDGLSHAAKPILIKH